MPHPKAKLSLGFYNYFIDRRKLLIHPQQKGKGVGVCGENCKERYLKEICRLFQVIWTFLYAIIDQKRFWAYCEATFIPTTNGPPSYFLTPTPPVLGQFFVPPVLGQFYCLQVSQRKIQGLVKKAFSL